MMLTEQHTKPLRTLLVEDAENDALRLVDTLQSGGHVVDWLRVDTEEALLDALHQPWDIVFSDFSMPRFSGTDALNILRGHDPDLPFIFVSDTIGECAAVEAMKSGAQDYVTKGQMTRFLPAVDRELRESRSRREHRQTDEMLLKLSSAVKQSADSVFITNPDGLIEYANPAFEHLTGYTVAEAKGKTPAILCSGQHNSKCYQQLWETLARGEVYRGTLINTRKNGELFHEEKVITPLKDINGHITHYVSSGRDITARVQSEEEKVRLAAVLEATPDMVAILEPNGLLRYLNGAGYRMLGLEVDNDIQGRCIEDFFTEPLAQQMIDHIMPSVQSKGVWSGESVLSIANGKEIPVSQVILAHHDSNGDIEYLSTIARDISERKRFEAELHYRATHDSLTDLPNRFFLIERFNATLEIASRNGTFLAVLFLDLNNFKRVNDSLGHAAGDSLIKEVAVRLKTCLRPNDTVARIGGDEFTIVIADLIKTENSLVVLRKLRTVFDRPIIIDSHEVYVTFSTGIALYPHDGDNVEDLLHHADSAMYQAKASASNQYRFYAPDMNARGHELLTMEAELRHAIEHDEFILHFQPQLDLRSGRIAAVEGLIRWQHPTRGIIPPADFIPLLENSGLIISVGEWVMRQACIMHRAWREGGYGDIRISINVSAAQFNEDDLLDKIRRAIQEEGVPAQMLELEITENIVMRDPATAADLLKMLHAIGVRTAIDDFGTGYSSLAYLKRFPLNALKIDRTFVTDLGHNPEDAAIVEASISLGQKLGLDIIAEGVETEEQLKFLHSHHCDLVQGYLLSLPMPMDDVTQLISMERNGQHFRHRRAL